MTEHASDRAGLPTRVFLTGGSGYVGRNLIRHLVARDVAVVALARSPAAMDTVAGLGASPFAGDLFSLDLAAGMTGCDALIHAAADLDHGLGGSGQRRTNVEGTRRVFETARSAGIAQAVLISTESVLLDGSPLVDADETRPFPARPAGSYSATKAEAERCVLALATPTFAAMAVRPRMVWGRDDTTALPQLAAMARSGRLAWIGGGDYPTSTTHIANLAHGVACALRHGRGGEAYFVTDGAPVSFRAFVTELLATQGIAAPDRRVPRALVRWIAILGDAAARASGGRIRPPLTRQEYATAAVPITLDIGKAGRELGYAPILDRAEGMAELARDAVERPDGLRYDVGVARPSFSKRP